MSVDLDRRTSLAMLATLLAGPAAALPGDPPRPSATARRRIDKLVATLQATLKDPAVVRRHSELGAEVVSTDRATPDALQKHLTAEIARWSPIIKKAGVYAD